MGNGGEPVGTPEKRGDLGGSQGETDSDGQEKVGMVRARYKKMCNRKHPSSCGNEDGGEAP